MKLAFFLRQSLNFPGLLQSIKSLTQPQLLVPSLSIESINHIDLQRLKSLGVTCVVFDKDNTLSITYATEIHPSLKGKVNEFKVSFPNSIAILSNSVGSCDDIDFAEAKLVEASLDIPVILHMTKKPNCLKEVIEHFSLKLGRSIVPRELCMIGDRVLTDVVFANKNGMISVLVKPIDNWRDHPISSLLRLFETKILLPLCKLTGIKA